MNKPNNKFRWMLILLVLMMAIPIGLGWLLIRNPHLLTGQVNNGHLIIPAMPIERTRLIGFDRFSIENISELEARWVMVHLISEKGCSKPSLEALHTTRQLRLMLGKDLFRIRRLAIVSESLSSQQAKLCWTGHDYLLRTRLSVELKADIEEGIGQVVVDGMVFLMDPLGNLMMWYEPGFDPYKIKKDLTRLLHVSQIG